MVAADDPSTTRPGRSEQVTWKTLCWRTWEGRLRRLAAAAVPGDRHDLADLATVPRPGHLRHGDPCSSPRSPWCSTGMHLAEVYAASGVNTCHAPCGPPRLSISSPVSRSARSCGAVLRGHLHVYLAPALIGIFWGAPLIGREIETGTLRLAWSQSVQTPVGRREAGLVGLAAILRPSCSACDHLVGRPGSPRPDRGHQESAQFRPPHPLLFEARGIAPLGYAAFAFALGVTAGLLIRGQSPPWPSRSSLFAAVQLLVPSVHPARNIITPVKDDRGL